MSDLITIQISNEAFKKAIDASFDFDMTPREFIEFAIDEFKIEIDRSEAENAAA
jgi:hypothetical protein